MIWDEDIATGLEKWLKERRDEHKSAMLNSDSGEQSYYAIDSLLDETRECAAMGFFPWWSENQEYQERDHH